MQNEKWPNGRNVGRATSFALRTSHFSFCILLVTVLIGVERAPAGSALAPTGRRSNDLLRACVVLTRAPVGVPVLVWLNPNRGDLHRLGVAIEVPRVAEATVLRDRHRSVAPARGAAVVLRRAAE